MLTPRACSQTPSKAAVYCSLSAKAGVSTVLMEQSEPLQVGQHVPSHGIRNAVFPGEREKGQSVIYIAGSRVWLKFPTCLQKEHAPSASASSAPVLPARAPRLPAEDEEDAFSPAPLWSLQSRALCCVAARNARVLPTSLLLSKCLCSCCLWWEWEVWGCLEIAAPRQRHKVHPPSLQNIGLMKNLLFDERSFIPSVAKNVLSLCNELPFFFCFHLILFHWGFSPLPFLYWILLSLSIFLFSASIFLFFSINECLLVTEQLKLNMITRPRREILNSCREKTHPGVTWDKQRHVCFHIQMFYHVTLNHIKIMPGGTLSWDSI